MSFGHGRVFHVSRNSIFGLDGQYILFLHPAGGYSHTLPIWVCAAQRGRDFEAPDLERGIHFRGVF